MRLYVKTLNCIYYEVALPRPRPWDVPSPARLRSSSMSDLVVTQPDPEPEVIEVYQTGTVHWVDERPKPPAELWVPRPVPNKRWRGL